MRFLLALCLSASVLSVGESTLAQKPAQRESTTVASPTKSWRAPAASRKRRVIFNNDGNEPTTVLQRVSKQEFLDARSSPLIGSQVDSIFYCTTHGGFGAFTHLTKVGQIFTTKEGRYATNPMAEFAAAGLDPLQLIVEFCKQNKIEVFWSLRMNDTHDGAKADYGPVMFRANKLKNEHPEYLLGSPENRPKYGSWTAVNYELPEVRDWAFRFVEEICKTYDVNGVELDFFRHPVFFETTARGELATDKQRDAMTDLLKRIRTMADEVGRRRGRPILIAAKTPDSVEYARAIGLDIEKWMADDLIDLFIPAGYFQLNDWKYSVELGHKYGVKVYPSLDDSRVREEAANELRKTPAAFRGRAAEAWAAGADGVYFFNSFDPHSPLWNEVGDPKQLATLDKDYFASIRGANTAAGGNLPYKDFQKIEILNPASPKTISAAHPATTRINIAEAAGELKSAAFTLRLQFNNPLQPSEVSVKINGQQLASLQAAGRWLESRVPNEMLREGENVVEVSLAGTTTDEVEWTDLVIEKRSGLK